MALKTPPPHAQTAIPNIRGENETEILHLTNLIETTAYPLLPSCITLLGRHPRDTTYLASLYSVGKQGLKGLEYGPEVGGTRLEALRKLLDAVEIEIGRMLVRDGKRADREAQEGRREGVSAREVGLVRWEKGKNERANWE